MVVKILHSTFDRVEKFEKSVGSDRTEVFILCKALVQTLKDSSQWRAGGF